MSQLEGMIEIANPHEPHVATVLILDTSGSMAEQGKIDQLNQGLRVFKEDIIKNDLARKRVDLAVITFGNRVELIQDFGAIEEFSAPALYASGETPLGEALLKAMDLIEERKAHYKREGIDYYRPWIFMITDGQPTDMVPGDPKWKEVVARITGGEDNRKFTMFAVGVDPANLELLGQLSPPQRPPLRLAQGKFSEMFLWLSKSQQVVSGSAPGQQRVLPPATWGTITA